MVRLHCKRNNWLHQLLKRLKLSQQKLSVSYAVYAASMGVSGMAQVILFVTAAKWMDVTEFGLFGMLLIVLPLVSRGLMFGADTGYAMRIWRTSPSEQGALLGATISMMLITVVLLLLVSLALSTTLLGWDLVVMVLVIALAMCRSLVDLSLITLRRTGRILSVGAVQAFRGVVILLFPVALFLLKGANAINFLVGSLIGEVLIVLYTIPILQSNRWRLFQLDWLAQLIVLLKLGLPGLIMMFAMLLMASGDRLVIASVLGLSAVAVYTLGQKFAEYLVQIVFAPFSAALGPIAWQRAARDMDESTRLLNKAAALQICAAGAMIGLVAVVIREVIFYGYGGDYADSAAVFLLVAYAVVVAQVAQTFASYFSHAEKLFVPMKIYLSASVCMLLASYTLAADVGVIGVAAISVVTYSFVIGVVVWLARLNGGNLWRQRQHFVPFFVYALFLSLVGLVDMVGWPSLLAIAVKLMIWASFVYALFRISNEFRVALVAMLQRSSASSFLSKF